MPIFQKSGIHICVCHFFFVILHAEMKIIFLLNNYKAMKIYQLPVLICAFAASVLLTGCRSDVDVNNIDTSAELEMGIALPIGSMSFTIEDFLGTGLGNFYIDTIHDEQDLYLDVITWKDTFDIERNFHADSLDLTNMVSSKKLTLNVFDYLSAYPTAPDGKKYVPGSDTQATIRFTMPITLKGINKEMGGDRLDSALIEMARFTSQIQTQNMNLDWNWIDEVNIELGAQVNRPAGNTMVVYRKGEAGGYGQDINTDIDAFTICLMKNRNLNPATEWSKYEINNVIDTCTFYINFKFTIPSGETAVVSPGGGFDYNLDVAFIKYTAIWGKFVASNDMHDEDTIMIKDYIGMLDFLTRANMPFAYPKIDMHVITHIAGAITLDGDYLYAIDANNKKTYAEFYASRQHNFSPVIVEGQYLPLSSQIGDSTTNLIIPFSEKDDQGRIDRLFANMPQMLGYKFNVNFNYQKTPQIRITPNTAIRISAICKLPMIFNHGLFIDYNDTIKDVKLSQFSIDSLIADVDVIDTVKASNLRLVLNAENTMPLDIKGVMRCFDEQGNMLMDPNDPTKPLMLFEEDPVRGDTLYFAAAKYTNTYGIWAQTEPGKTRNVVRISKAKMDMLPKIKNIVYYAVIDDKSLNASLPNFKLTKNMGLKFKIGLSANADAIFNFDNKNNNQ